MSEPIKAIANLLLLLLLARIQMWIPGWLPVLPAGVFVLMVRRPAPEAAVCLLWAGIIIDALEGTQLLVSASFFLLIFALRGIHGRFAIVHELSAGSLIACGFFCAGHALWRSLWTCWTPFSRVLIVVPSGILSGVLVALALSCLDRHAGRLDGFLGKEGRP